MSTPTQYAGIALIVLGCLFAAAGLAKFIVGTVNDARAPETKKGFAATDPAKWADLVTAVGKLPPFAISTVLGVALIIVGSWLSQGHAPIQ